MAQIPCPECGRLARIVQRFTLASTDGPVEHLNLVQLVGYTARLRTVAPRLRLAGRPREIFGREDGPLLPWTNRSSAPACGGSACAAPPLTRRTLCRHEFGRHVIGRPGPRQPLHADRPPPARPAVRRTLAGVMLTRGTWTHTERTRDLPRRHAPTGNGTRTRTREFANPAAAHHPLHLPARDPSLDDAREGEPENQRPPHLPGHLEGVGDAVSYGPEHVVHRFVLALPVEAAGFR